jgi:hypothetical protein
MYVHGVVLHYHDRRGTASVWILSHRATGVGVGGDAATEISPGATRARQMRREPRAALHESVVVAAVFMPHLIELHSHASCIYTFIHASRYAHSRRSES